MENSQSDLSSNLQQLKASYSLVNWREDAEGQFVPASNYDDALRENDGEELNKIEWRKLKLVKKELNKVKLDGLKPGDVAYHQVHGYVRLKECNQTKQHQDDALNWECQVIKPKTTTEEEEKDKKEETKVNVNPKELHFYVNIPVIVQLENQTTSASMRLNVTDKLQDLVKTLEKIHNATFLALHNGKQVDPEQTLSEIGITENSQLYLNGVYGGVEISVGGKVKYFRRFRDVRADGWYMGRDRWDGVTFIPSKNVKIFGIGIFEAYPSNTTPF